MESAQNHHNKADPVRKWRKDRRLTLIESEMNYSGAAAPSVERDVGLPILRARGQGLF